MDLQDKRAKCTIVPRPSKADLIRAAVLCYKMSPAVKEFILNLSPDPAAPALDAKHLPDPASLQKLVQEGVIMNTAGSPTLTYFGKIVQYRLLQEQEYITHPEWLEPFEGGFQHHDEFDDNEGFNEDHKNISDKIEGISHELPPKHVKSPYHFFEEDP